MPSRDVPVEPAGSSREVTGDGGGIPGHSRDFNDDELPGASLDYETDETPENDSLEVSVEDPDDDDDDDDDD